ncbi:MAG: DnaJ domain-containing protein [Spirochaetaceae bacterium]
MAVNKVERRALDGVVAEIEASRTDRGWRLSTERLAEAIGVDTVTLFRTIYDNPRGVTFAEAIDGFDEERAGELVTLLEQLGFRGAEEHLYRAGIFVPLSAGSRLSERLVGAYVRELSRHDVDWERIAFGLRSGRSYREVAWNYLSEELPMEPVAEKVSERFLEEEEIAVRGKESLLRYLRTLRERHVLDYAVVGAPLYEEVYRYAVIEGYIKPRERERYYGRGARREGRFEPSSRKEDSMEWARSVLGVNASAGKGEVRRAYRRQMLRYHPDVNSSGTEVAKELNAAYATLLRSIEDSP